MLIKISKNLRSTFFLTSVLKNYETYCIKLSNFFQFVKNVFQHYKKQV